MLPPDIKRGHVQVRRRKDPTIPQQGYVTVLWYTRCCQRHEGAEKVDKWLKYASSMGVSLLLCIASFYICSILVRSYNLFRTRTACGHAPVPCTHAAPAHLAIMPARTSRPVRPDLCMHIQHAKEHAVNSTWHGC